MASPGQDIDSLSTSCEVNLDKTYFTSYFTDSWKIISSPVRWQGKEWMAAAAVGGVSVLAYWQDDAIRDLFQRNRSEHLDHAAEYFFEPLGRGYVCLSIAAGFYLAGEVGNRNKLKETGLAAFKSVVLTSVFTYVLKYATQRHDPQADHPPDPRIWEGPFGSYEHTSFPSGHSAAIFALASVISTAYKDRVWVPVLSYSLASLAAVSRIYEDEHWSSDVIIGSALGFAVGKLVYKSTVSCPHLVMIPGISADGHPGFTFIYQMQ
jgi:membrane-associated phospholipid phosphatase